MLGMLGQASAGTTTVGAGCRNSGSLTTGISARPHLAPRRPLQLVASSKPHNYAHQSDRSSIEPLDVEHGQHQQQHPHHHQQQQDPRRQGPPRWRAWLGSIGSVLPLFKRDADADRPAADGKAWSLALLLAQLRMLLLGGLAACMLMLVRYTVLLQARTAPREVLYSDFVALLDTGKVKAARLEAASSRLFFECHASQEAAAVPAAAAAAVAAASSSSSISPASSSSLPAAEAVAVATPAAAKPSLRRRFYIKLADKQDPLLVGKIIAAGGETVALGNAGTASPGAPLYRVVAMLIWCMHCSTVQLLQAGHAGSRVHLMDAMLLCCVCRC